MFENQTVARRSLTNEIPQSFRNVSLLRFRFHPLKLSHCERFFSSAAHAILYPSGITPPRYPYVFTKERKKDGENIMALFFPRLFPGKTGSILGERELFFSHRHQMDFCEIDRTRDLVFSHILCDKPRQKRIFSNLCPSSTLRSTYGLLKAQ